MAYADRNKTGENTVGTGIAAFLLIVLGWALYTGLAAEGFRALVKKVTTVDIKKDEPKKEEKPPPPKKDAAPPPIVVPPPMTNINMRPPPLETTPVPMPPPPIPQPVVLAPPAPAAPPPRIQPKGAQPKGNPANWATTNDYPTRALREERAGTTGFRVTVGPDGKVTSCSVTSSSGSPDLDEATCSNVTRRGRFAPATDGEGNPTTGSYSNRIRWVIPTD